MGTARLNQRTERGGKSMWRGLVVMCGAVVLLVTGLSGPAAADSRTFRDSAGDTGGAPSDITKVVVTNGADAGRRVVVTAHVGNLAPTDSARMWVDTRPADAGPEYRMTVIANSDGVHLRRVETWTGDGHAVHCPGLRALADGYGKDIIRFSIPRACMDKPGPVRVGLRGRFPYASRVVIDWAPGWRQFTPWVRR